MLTGIGTVELDNGSRRLLFTNGDLWTYNGNTGANDTGLLKAAFWRPTELTAAKRSPRQGVAADTSPSITASNDHC